MSINTHKQYWPKLSMIVVYLVETAAREPATTPEITPARFLAFLQHEDRRREEMTGRHCSVHQPSSAQALGRQLVKGDKAAAAQHKASFLFTRTVDIQIKPARHAAIFICHLYIQVLVGEEFSGIMAQGTQQP